MDSVVTNLVAVLLTGGGPQAVIALLILFAVILLFDRKRLYNELNRKDEKFDRVLAEYYRGHLTLTEAMISLKQVLTEIKGKL